MLSYELCKKLKEAGFPWPVSSPQQIKHWGEHSPSKNSPVEYCNQCELYMTTKDHYIPTLSELIDACGDKFIALEYLQRKGLKPGWSIVGKDIRNENVFNGGATPEEAVANLWLAINCSSEAEKADIAITNLWLALNKKKI